MVGYLGNSPCLLYIKTRHLQEKASVDQLSAKIAFFLAVCAQLSQDGGNKFDHCLTEEYYCLAEGKKKVGCHKRSNFRLFYSLLFYFIAIHVSAHFLCQKCLTVTINCVYVSMEIRHEW